MGFSLFCVGGSSTKSLLMCEFYSGHYVLQVKCLTQTAFKCEFKLSQQKMQLFFVNICLYLHSSNLLKLPVRFSFAVV